MAHDGCRCWLDSRRSPQRRPRTKYGRPICRSTRPGQAATPCCGGRRCCRACGCRSPCNFPTASRNVTEPNERQLPELDRRTSHRSRRQTDLPGKRIEFVGLQATITDVLVRVKLIDGLGHHDLVRPSIPWVDIEAAAGAPAGRENLHHAAASSTSCSAIDHLLFVLALMLIARTLARAAVDGDVLHGGSFDHA